MSHQDAPGSEDREMLARLAANAHNSQSGDDEAAIEKYLRSVLSLENILTLDRLRQVDMWTFLGQWEVLTHKAWFVKILNISKLWFVLLFLLDTTYIFCD